MRRAFSIRNRFGSINFITLHKYLSRFDSISIISARCFIFVGHSGIRNPDSRRNKNGLSTQIPRDFHFFFVLFPVLFHRNSLCSHQFGEALAPSIQVAFRIASTRRIQMPDAISIVSFSTENTQSDSMVDFVRHMLCRNVASAASDDTSTDGDQRQRSDSHFPSTISEYFYDADTMINLCSCSCFDCASRERHSLRCECRSFSLSRSF